MQHEAILAATTMRRRLANDAVVALLIAALLVGCWAANDWEQLSRLVLPDNDDMMRLAQVRDWIAGQGFNDWTQYRLAPRAGGPMHWSRINDIGIAGIIVAARPLLGTHGAELLAVTAYPGLLFATYLFLSARIARRLGGADAGLVALIVAALAFPANSLFLPGRIDHHALQIVLMLCGVLALMRAPSLASGAAAGLAVALSLAIGLESAPQVAALMAVLWGLWAWRGTAERPRLLGFGAALAGVTLLLLAVARPHLWSATWCDAFTPASTDATLVAAALWIGLAAATPWFARGTARASFDKHGMRAQAGWRLRAGIGALAGAAALGAVLLRYPGCLSGPYGPMDPLVRRWFMDNVIEAQGLFLQAPFGMGIPSAGLMLTATLTAGWYLARNPGRRVAAAPLVAALLLSDLVLLAQIRGAYLGSALAAPLMAQLILAARRRAEWRLPALVGAWAVSAGMVWLMVPERIGRALQPEVRATFLAHRACNAGDTWQQLDAYPAGVVMAPMDRAAYVIGATHHSSVAAGYHRSNAGNRAMYDFFLAPPDTARHVAAAWHARYVVLCPTDFSELDIARAHPGSLAARLLAGAPPEWIAPIPLRDTGLGFYRIR